MKNAATDKMFSSGGIRANTFANTSLFKSEKASAAKRRRRWKRNIQGWLFSIWPFVGYLLFFGVPFVFSIVLSMSELHGFDITEFTFVGLENYKWIFTDPQGRFWFSVRQTLIYALSLPISIVLGLTTAVLLTRHVKLTRLFRTILFIPNVCSVVGVSMMWRLVFNGNYGVLNTIITAFVGEGNWTPIDWLNSPFWFMPAVILTTTWGAGAGSILFQAALEQVDKTLIEAAKIDGASRRKIFFSVTLPAISPTTFYVLVMNSIGVFQAFANIQVLTNSGITPMDSKGRSIPMTAVYFIYYMAFEKTTLYGLGRASACAWVLTIIIGLFTVVNFKVSKFWVHYDD